VYLEYWSKLYVYGNRILKDQQVCEDLIQEIFLSYWEKRKDVAVENTSAYLFQSLRYQIYNHFRDTKFTTLDIDKFSNYVQINTTEELLDLKDSQLLLKIALDKLSERCQEIFYLSRFEHLSHKEISDKLNISTQTVKNQITIALNHLRTQYKPYSFLLFLLGE